MLVMMLLYVHDINKKKAANLATFLDLAPRPRLEPGTYRLTEEKDSSSI